MKMHSTKSGGYVEGDTALHKLRAQTKIVAAFFLLVGSGICSDWSLAMIGLLSVVGVCLARVPVRKIFQIIRRMAWFFLAIVIFPVLFTPGFYIDLPAWVPVTISREGLLLGLESSLRLLNILFVSLVLIRTTSSADWTDGLEKILGPMGQRLPIIRDMLAVAVMAVKFLPMLFAETEQFIVDHPINKNERGYKKLLSLCHSILQYIAWIFSDIDRWSVKTGRAG
ncbi:MAG: hypothetical protein COW89_09410 [Nitrospinae bacterium CG22_combo_CG10-13_8_21_14_all_47_10]|nr:MAG: hypothetical protein COW89_09410 [Nitrospinae bacterium CG22_combo_CG10-13_8_21_14_all_47_10]